MITGGCHYNFECKNFQKTCENCPAFGFFLKYQKNLREKNIFMI